MIQLVTKIGNLITFFGVPGELSRLDDTNSLFLYNDFIFYCFSWRLGLPRSSGRWYWGAFAGDIT